jgi:hypothetical protein
MVEIAHVWAHSAARSAADGCGALGALTRQVAELRGGSGEDASESENEGGAHVCIRECEGAGRAVVRDKKGRARIKGGQVKPCRSSVGTSSLYIRQGATSCATAFSPVINRAQIEPHVCRRVGTSSTRLGRLYVS